ncbi:MAG TPA: hypothetical protein VNZ26_12260 [Vicinamibacterales bacterium]|nr:hypothetical protein [Vicinamibacterales bacterium]
MNRWTEIFLGVIAIATLAMAAAQIGIIITASLLARRVARLADSVERELKPIFGHLNAIGRDASRAAALATAQIERADKMVADLGVRFDDALVKLQSSLSVPAREGRALLSAFRAAFDAVREARQSGRTRQGRGEDEDALFI